MITPLLLQGLENTTAAEGVHRQLSHHHLLDIVCATEALPPPELMCTEQKQANFTSPGQNPNRKIGICISLRQNATCNWSSLFLFSFMLIKPEQTVDTNLITALLQTSEGCMSNVARSSQYPAHRHSCSATNLMSHPAHLGSLSTASLPPCPLIFFFF